ncbi:MAG: BTAD domain-containing putative transcriptional regulator [Lachnospiraceae bacterium]|nr:winged helix-turn-helix domain-containing protein [Agathobacter sp.]MDD6290747.1 BTAD domain-containing putative transcriptional regulator [Lachnospiraceae bacterium]
MLTVNSLGKFQLTDGNVVVNEDDLRSIMLSKLLMYILLYRDKTLTTEDIATAIWQDEEIDNPAGALKNLMYRLRKNLAKYFGNQDFILTNRGSYRWNTDVEVNLDIEQFEKLINEAKQENVYERAILMYEQAIAIYQGDFMTKLTDMHWILTLNTYYHSLYLTCVKALSELYLKMERYEEMERICTDALKLENADEQLYCYQIEARMHCGKINLAFDSYDEARIIMEKELGIRKTTILNKVYEELMAISKGGVSYNISEVKKDIEEENPSGVFLCGYPIFKEIYHLEVRKSTRSDSPENLVLLTLEPKKEDTKEVAEFRIKQAMNGLEETICECLRVGDVAAKYSDSQFILLLPTCTKDLAMLVANRIVSKMYEKNSKYKKVNVKINIEEVSQDGNLVD